MDTFDQSSDLHGAAAAPLAYRSFTLRPRFRSLLLAFLLHRNPFYLLSALCMIAGCFALNSALDLGAGQVWGVVVLIGTINLYELLLIGLGLFLIRSRGFLRDGRTLLLLQVVFLTDFTFLGAATANADRRLGLIINVFMLLLALAKVAAVLWTLSPGFRIWRFALIALQLAALNLIPTVFAHLDDGSLRQRPFVAAWWVIGFLAALTELRRWLPGGAPSPSDAMPQPRMSAIYGIATFVSLLSHIGMLHWVYRVTYTLADAAPVLLGIAMAAHSVTPTRFLRATDIRLLRIGLPLAAVLACLAEGGAEPLAETGWLTITPTLLTFSAVLVMYVYFFASPFTLYAIAGEASIWTFLICGPSPRQSFNAGTSAWSWSTDLIVRVMPRTALQWGITAIAGAFAFLGIGAALSLARGKTPESAPAPISQETEEDVPM